ncbi:MAG: hypothetical protein M1822_009342 [Bathelium mastoideum]|nr:MAG: hypothetical protein M1822_009342 [Bathelium mastoideum]
MHIDDIVLHPDLLLLWMRVKKLMKCRTPVQIAKSPEFQYDSNSHFNDLPNFGKIQSNLTPTQWFRTKFPGTATGYRAIRDNFRFDTGFYNPQTGCLGNWVVFELVAWLMHSEEEAMQSSHQDEPKDWIGVIDQILAGGTSINGIHGSRKRTPIQGFIYFSMPCEKSCSKEVLKFLIAKGADLHMCDGSGCEVLKTAYDENFHFLSNDYHSYKRDLWDVVLVESGYDIATLRRKYSAPRKAQYTSRYTRQDFERLWHGIEDQCPYWDDPPVWPPDCLEDSTMMHEHRDGENSILSLMRVLKERREDD